MDPASPMFINKDLEKVVFTCIYEGKNAPRGVSWYKVSWSSPKLLKSCVLSYQFKLIKMHAKLANLDHSAVPFLSRASVNLCWYYYVLFVGNYREQD